MFPILRKVRCTYYISCIIASQLTAAPEAISRFASTSRAKRLLSKTSLGMTPLYSTYGLHKVCLQSESQFVDTGSALFKMLYVNLLIRKVITLHSFQGQSYFEHAYVKQMTS
jgi:hypothetical protein